jgi:hypothetical protein
MISKERIATFLFGCILLRSVLVYLAYYLQENQHEYLLNLLIAVCFVIGLSMILIYFGYGIESADKQLQGWKDDDSVLWWNHLRPLHGFLFILFAVLTFLGYKNTWVILLLDTLIGLSAWLMHHKFITC